MGRHPARWWHTDGHVVVCDLCPHACRLHDGQTGLCRVRTAAGDRLETLVYGAPWSLAVDPIEKKPLFHVYPGSSILSLGTAGCNLRCAFCQNDGLVYAPADEPGDGLAPAAVATLAVARRCRSVAFTYNEPTVFAEYALDTARACQAAGLATVMVTNGYIASAARAEVYGAIDAANVDLKFFDDAAYRRWTGAHLAPVLDTIGDLLRRGVWVEVTTLLIPGLNDADATLGAEFEYLAATFGRDLPLHLSAFHPAYHMTDRPRTPTATIERARALALAAGLRFVYSGNVDDPDGESTRCPACAALVLERSRHRVTVNRLDAEGCCTCGARLSGRF